MSVTDRTFLCDANLPVPIGENCPHCGAPPDGLCRIRWKKATKRKSDSSAETMTATRNSANLNDPVAAVKRAENGAK